MKYLNAAPYQETRSQEPRAL